MYVLYGCTFCELINIFQIQKIQKIQYEFFQYNFIFRVLTPIGADLIILRLFRSKTKKPKGSHFGFEGPHHQDDLHRSKSFWTKKESNPSSNSIVALSKYTFLQNFIQIGKRVLELSSDRQTDRQT